MKLQQWAHWAEITASAAVVVTLIFLVQEVGANTAALDRPYAEATAWERHLWMLWTNLEADFSLTGGSSDIAVLARDLASYPDNQIYLEYAEEYGHSPTFLTYLRSLQDTM